MIDIAILRAMAAAGAPVEAILAAIEADQAKEIARVQARRAADAQRQRNKRRNVHRTPCDSSGQCVTPKDSTDADVALSSFLSSSNNSEIKKKEESKRERSPRKTALPDDWAPKQAHYAKAPRSIVEQKADDMRNWARSKGVMRVDWDATFYGFLRPKEGAQRMNGHGTGPSLMDAFDRLNDRAAGAEVGGSPEIRDITPGSD